MINQRAAEGQDRFDVPRREELRQFSAVGNGELLAARLVLFGWPYKGDLTRETRRRSAAVASPMAFRREASSETLFGPRPFT